MKTIFKILSFTFLSILLLVILASISVKIFENSITKIALNQIEKRLNVPVELGDIDINITRSFPISKIELQDLELKTPDRKGTVASIKSLYFSINSKEALDGIYDVEKIEIDGFHANYLVGKDSLSNIDFLMNLIPTDTTINVANDSIGDSIPLYLNLKEILLNNITCSYFDSTTHTGANLHIPSIQLQGNINDDQYHIKTGGKMTITNVYFADYKLHLMQSANLDFDLDYNNDSVTISTFNITSDGILVKAKGIAKIGQDILVNSIIEEATFDLGEIIKYMPDSLKEEQGLISAKGIIMMQSDIIGTYNDSTLPHVNANYELKDIALVTKDYPEIRHFSSKGNMTNGNKQNNATTSISIDRLLIQTPLSELNLNAKIKDIDHPQYQVKSDGKVVIDEFISLMPDSLKEMIKGQINWNIETYGTMPAEINDDFNDYALARTKATIEAINLDAIVDSTLSVKSLNGTITYSPNHIMMEGVNLTIPEYDLKIKEASTDISYKGKTTDIDNMSVSINNMNAQFDDHSLRFKATLSNLYAPNYTFDGEMKLNLTKLQKFAPDTLIQSMSGIAEAKITSTGQIDLDSIETQGMDLAFKNSAISLYAKDLSVQMVDTLLGIENMNLKMHMASDSIVIDHFSGLYKTMTFSTDSTYIVNAYDAAMLNKAEQIEVYTSIKMGNIDYALFEPFMVVEETTDTDNNSTEAEAINYTFCVRGNMSIDNFLLEEYEVDSTMTLHNFDMSNISTDFKLTDSAYIMDQFKFDALGGHLNSSVRYEIRPKDTRVAFRSQIDNMDFKTLLYNMDNFGQTDVTSENISGQLFAKFDSEVIMYGDSIDLSATKLKGDFKLTNGGVYDFEPIQELSSFTGIKELDNIRFQTLETSLFVLKGAAYIPKTVIVNTAVDITAYGMQSFGDDYEYHLELNLGDVLTGKRSKLMERQEKAAKDEGKEVNRKGANLIAYSLDGKTKNKFDNKKSMDKMSRKIRLKEGLLGLKFYPEKFNFDTKKKCSE